MATEQVGGVEYYADVDVSGVLNGGKVINRTVDRAEKDFRKLDTQVNKTTKHVRTGLSRTSQSAGQAGIQLQQFVGQVQGGTSAMTALAQQGADLGIVLGAPLAGVVASLGAVLAGVLIPSLMDSKDEGQELEETMKRLNKAFSETEDGTYTLSERLRELAEVSEQAAMAEVAVAQSDARNAIKQATGAVDEQVGSFNGAISTLTKRFTPSLQEAVKELDNLGDVSRLENLDDPTLNTLVLKNLGNIAGASRNLQREFDITAQQSVEFVRALARVESEGSAESIQNLQNVVSGISQEYGFANEKVSEFIRGLQDVFESSRNAGEAIEQAERFLKNFNSEVDRTSESSRDATSQLTRLVDGIVRQANTVNMSERELAKWTAAQLGATESQLKNIDILYDYIEGKEKEAEADRKSSQEKQALVRKYESLTQKMREQYAVVVEGKDPFEVQIEQYRRLAQGAGKSADEIQRNIDKMREIKGEQEADKEREQVAGAAQGVGLTDLQALEQRYNQEREALLAAQEAGIQSKISYEERLTELQRQYSEERKRIVEGETQNAIINFDSLANRAAGAFASVAVGAQTGTEAVRGLAMSIAQEAIGALVRMAIQSTILRQQQTAQGVAQAASLTAAYAPAAAAASVATSGGAAAAGSAALAAAIPAMLGAFALGSGRLYGGNVAPGKLYPVTEDGRPEVLTQGNKQYLLPGSRGNVTSNRDMGGMMGGATVNIDIVNNAAGMVSVTPSSSERDGQTDIKFIIDAVRNDVLEGGSVYSAIKERTNAGTKTG